MGQDNGMKEGARAEPGGNHARKKEQPISEEEGVS